MIFGFDGVVTAQNGPEIYVEGHGWIKLPDHMKLSDCKGCVVHFILGKE